MEPTKLTVLLLVMISFIVYLNFVVVNKKKIELPVKKLNRYENTLKEHFQVNTQSLRDEVNALSASPRARNNRRTLNNRTRNMVMNAVTQDTQVEEEEDMTAQNNSGETAETVTTGPAEATNDLNSMRRNSENSQNSEVTIDSLMKNLEESEMLCSRLDRDQKIKDDLEQISINKSALQELDNQEKRIQELTQIVSAMRREKQKRDYISNKCRVNNQNQLDRDYTTVQELSRAGLLKDQSYKVNMNVPKEGVKLDLKLPQNVLQAQRKQPRRRNNNTNLANTRACSVKGKPGFDLKKLDSGVCHGCNPDAIRNKINKANIDFRR